MARNVAILISFFVTPAVSSGAEFDFKDPKRINSVIFVLDSLVEPIIGVASEMSGILTFDPSHPELTSGSIVIPAAAVHLENQSLKRRMHSDSWLAVKKYPTIEFRIKSVTGVQTDTKRQIFKLTAVGDFA